MGHESPVLSVPLVEYFFLCQKPTKGEGETNGDQLVTWRYPDSVMLFPFPWLLVNSGDRILYVNAIGSSSSPKSETLDNKGWGLFVRGCRSLELAS